MANKKQILHARSKEDGIIFYSQKFPALCYEGYLDEKGNVQTRMQPTMVSEMEDYCGTLFKNKNRNKKFYQKMRLVVLALALVTVFITNKVSIAMGLTYFAFFFMQDLIELFDFAFRLKKGDLQSTGRFHSAEHMAISAYEEFQRVPTLDEIKTSTRYRKTCGSRVIISKVFFGIFFTAIISSCAYLSMPVYFLLSGILLLAIIIEGKTRLLRWFQVFVTNTPTDKELEVALASIQLYEEMEEHMPDGFMPFGMIVVEIHG